MIYCLISGQVSIHIFSPINILESPSQVWPYLTKGNPRSRQFKLNQIIAILFHKGKYIEDFSRTTRPISTNLGRWHRISLGRGDSVSYKWRSCPYSKERQKQHSENIYLQFLKSFFSRTTGWIIINLAQSISW